MLFHYMLPVDFTSTDIDDTKHANTSFTESSPSLLKEGFDKNLNFRQ